ncbi:MAG TPA: HEAT repeat domain-containing protein [Candidatus Obscuribacterales bacterium]
MKKAQKPLRPPMRSLYVHMLFCLSACIPMATATPANQQPLPHSAHSHLSNHQALEQLVAQLHTSTAQKRISALKALSAMGPAAAKAVPDIIAVLNDNRYLGAGAQFSRRISPAVTDAAIEAFSKIGKDAADAAPYLVQMLDDRNELFRRQQIMDALSNIGADNTATATIMRVVCEEGKFTNTRLQAIKLLGQIRPPAVDSIDLLKEIAEDKNDQEARKAALQSLSSISQAAQRADYAKPTADRAEQVTLTAKLAAGQDKSDRLAALNKVSDLGAKASPLVPKLIAMLDDGDSDIESADLDALANIGVSAAAATPALVAHLFVQKDDSRRADICHTISVIDPQGKLSIPLVQPALDDPFKAKIALELLDELGTPSSSSVAEATRKRWCLK